MFDHGFGPDIRKFIGPLKHRASSHDDQGFQTILVTATMTKVFLVAVVKSLIQGKICNSLNV